MTTEKTSGRELSVARSGGGLLTLLPAGITGVNPLPLAVPDARQEVIIAAWQSKETGVPHRCVVRCDGWIQQTLGNLAINPVQAGFPCGVLRVDYAIGSYNRSVLVECVNQSALTLWAESIEVVKVWDRNRIAALAAWFTSVGSEWPGMCIVQRVAAAISLDDRGGDTGEADARYWNIVPFTNSEGTFTYFIEIPAGARALRLLDGTGPAGLVRFDDYLTRIGWTADPRTLGGGPQQILYQDRVPNNTCALEVPPNATHVILNYGGQADTDVLSLPFIIEWVLAPAYK